MGVHRLNEQMHRMKSFWHKAAVYLMMKQLWLDKVSWDRKTEQNPPCTDE